MSLNVKFGDVIVGNNLVYQGSLLTENNHQITEPKEFIPSFLDLCQLAENIILHDRLITHENIVPDQFKTNFYETLQNKKIFQSFDLINGRTDSLKQLASGFLKYDLGGYISISGKTKEEGSTPIEFFEKFLSDTSEREMMSHISKEKDYPFLDRTYSFENSTMDYSKEHSTYFNRTILFYLIALNSKQPYTPHYERIPIVMKIQKEINKNLVKPISKYIYDNVEDVLRYQQEELTKSGVPTGFYIPPIMAEVLKNSKKPQDIPNSILDLRDQTEDFRKNIREFEIKLQDEKISDKEKLVELRSWEVKTKKLVEETTKLTPDRSIFSHAPDVVSMLIAVSNNPFKTIGEILVKYPIEKILSWSSKRQLTFFYDMKDNYLNMKGKSKLIKNIFGVSLSQSDIDQYSTYSSILNGLKL